MRLRSLSACALVASLGAPLAVTATLGSLSACSFDGSGVSDDDSVPDDDGSDPPDATPPPDAECGGADVGFEVANLSDCAIPRAHGEVAFPTGSIVVDTTTGEITTPDPAFTADVALTHQTDGVTEVMVLSGTNIIIPTGATVTVRGSRPFAIVATTTLAIGGTLAAHGTLAAAGPGADVRCGEAAGIDGVMQMASNSVPGGSGGGGGAYATDGGTGAYVSPAIASPISTAGGEQRTDVELSPLRGGCSGGRGGVAADADVRASGGGGGGGLQLVAGESLLITGIVSVSGGGGGGAGATGAGGGGGGSGGALLIQTPALTLDAAKVTANGGAGGEGRRDTGAGSPGEDGSITSATAAKGGTGVAGGNGGNGAVMMDDGKPAEVGTGSSTNTAGGGGGGGGMGRIHLRTSNAVMKSGNPVVSPPETTATL